MEVAHNWEVRTCLLRTQDLCQKQLLIHVTRFEIGFEIAQGFGDLQAVDVILQHPVGENHVR